MRRPASLAQVAELSDDKRAFAYALSEFLDQFRLERLGAIYCAAKKRAKFSCALRTACSRASSSSCRRICGLN